MPPNAPTLLVVDDEVGIRTLLRLVLSAHGYTVHEAAGGQEAVAVFRQHREIGGVLLDVQMPGMDGPATLQALRAIDPALRVALLGGAALGPDQEATLRAQGVHLFLAKPFQVAELMDVVKLLLGGANGGAAVGGA
jgi:CheY-like chemotaxis protein